MKRLNRLIYLAGPYTHKFKHIRERRNKQLTQISAMLMKQGIINYSPITHSHAQEPYIPDIGTGFEPWRENDFAFLSRCDEMWIAKLPGWAKSFGVSEEIKFCIHNKIKLVYIEPRFNKDLDVLDIDIVQEVVW